MFFLNVTRIINVRLFYDYSSSWNIFANAIGKSTDLKR
jgi:hypothetical protein